MDAVNLDTVIVVDETGQDEEFNIRHYPDMMGYIIPSPVPGRAVFRIEIPIEWPANPPIPNKEGRNR